MQLHQAVIAEARRVRCCIPTRTSVPSEISTVEKAVSLHFALLLMALNSWVLVISVASTGAVTVMEVG
ncbi:uncharacterized protein MONOS_4540 [Monocercomonoides exilis]|uniref:uncharacterized protein n=1 Tax=Monocercomonoides exilis TaxID=2049356 RepID=UPI00355A4DAE|nr:hypothetical protein MONOS_4540 [Monocercomonoides exilis]|eukprot:MONOS_4540.1-p1 / transcript=MONOS_4540.1 / gene=MONOS_4540 / organism=Monocercomonoides_exilis_PA203 / gene_product=unspecified product / transcript_product=unspecified product / location=Mono_scaffold00122:5686-5889(-) / protein_length=68 / sequence_SO=supercontig / SO=protein_coding / is_pseudo=false